MAVQVLVADDHPLFREAIVHLLKRTIPEVVIYEASSLRESKDMLSGHRGVSLLLLDLKLSDTNGIDGLLCHRRILTIVLFRDSFNKDGR